MNKKQGFTLIETIICLTILVLLIGGTLIFVDMKKNRERAESAAIMQTLHELARAASAYEEEYAMKYGRQMIIWTLSSLSEYLSKTKGLTYLDFPGGNSNYYIQSTIGQRHIYYRTGGSGGGSNQAKTFDFGDGRGPVLLRVMVKSGADDLRTF